MAGMTPSNVFILPIEDLNDSVISKVRRNPGASFINDYSSEVIYLPHIQDEFRFKRSAEYKKTPLLLAAENTLFYKHTSPLNFSLTWEWVAGLPKSGTGDPEYSAVDIMVFSNMVHSLVMPRGNLHAKNPTDKESSRKASPKPVIVGIGSWFRQRAVVEDVDIVYKEPWVHASHAEKGALGSGDYYAKPNMLNGDMMPMSIECTVSFEMTQYYDTTQAPTGSSTPGTPVGFSPTINHDVMKTNGVSFRPIREAIPDGKYPPPAKFPGSL